MRVVVIGGTGHIGTYLIPRLVQAGHEVINVSRGHSEPYFRHRAWGSVVQVEMDRSTAEPGGQFGAQLIALSPDAVIDLICFTPESARALVEALWAKVQHLLVCGTIWVHGPSAVVPTTEDQARTPFGDYGTKKAAIETYLMYQARRFNYPATMIHPGHICGPGWEPVNPAGHTSVNAFERLAQGDELYLPNLGMETLHHVHADDVAQAFMCALSNWSSAVGESFHATSSRALTLRGYAEAVAGWFGKEANLRFLPWEAWEETVSEEDARMTLDHISHSPNCSIAKARRLIGYEPRYTSLQAVHEALAWLIEHGQVNAPVLR